MSDQAIAAGRKPGGDVRAGRRLGLALAVTGVAQLMVVLDMTIVNVALPHIQPALGFSGSGLEWVVNAYAVAFGGLLLLGGRAGDLLGHRLTFIAGLLLFSAASVAGGFADSPAWLLAARAVQGAGGALVAPATLALIATTFPAGRERRRGMGVYAAMTGAGTAFGLIAGGLLVTYASWRWVLFVNAPIGVAVALLAPRALRAAPRVPGFFDLPGAIAGTAGLGALVYGLSGAAATPDGASHWGDAKVVASLAAGVALLAAFAVIESRSRDPLLPLRLLLDTVRAGAYLMMLGMSTALFGVLFFVALWTEDIWRYSALRAGIAFLPMTVVMLAASAAGGRLVARFGSRPLLIAGSAGIAGGLLWLSRITADGGYAGGLLGPTLVLGAGLGLLFILLPLVALAGVPATDTGIASSVLNTARQVGGSVGLAILGTVAWTVAAGTRGPAAGFDRAFLVGAGIAVLLLVIAVTMIRRPVR